MQLEDYRFESMNRDIQRLRTELYELEFKHTELSYIAHNSKGELSIYKKAVCVITAVVSFMATTSLEKYIQGSSKSKAAPTTQSSDASAKQAQ